MQLDITAQNLFEAGVHIGHQVSRWDPRSKPFVYRQMGGVSIIDLSKTLECLQSACDFLEETAAQGKSIWFVGTKKQCQEAIRESATSVQMPFVASRWMGGCLTNFETIKGSLRKYKTYLEMDRSGGMAQLANKKEESAIRREMARLHRNFEGLIDVNQLPAALFVIDIKHEHIAILEARKLGIPVVAIADTNANPQLVSYPIPGNDDAVKSINLLTQVVTQAISQGMALHESNRASQRNAQGAAPSADRRSGYRAARHSEADAQPMPKAAPSEARA
jgi:small subunit ribosomal protein S2